MSMSEVERWNQMLLSSEERGSIYNEYESGW